MFVTGIVTSPLYMSVERGSTALGNGKIDYFIYIPKSNIDSDIYSSIYVSVIGVDELNGLSEEYTNKIELVKNNLEKIKDERQKERYNELIDEL